MRGTAGIATAWMTSYTDIRLTRDNNGPTSSRGRTDPWRDGALWPNTRTIGSAGVMFGGGTECAAWDTISDEDGNQAMQKIRGFTRDANGAVLGSTIVQLFLASNDLFLRQLTSDPGGYFEACSEYAGQGHYIVAYLAGTPDVAGTTVNTLQPS